MERRFVTQHTVPSRPEFRFVDNWDIFIKRFLRWLRTKDTTDSEAQDHLKKAIGLEIYEDGHSQDKLLKSKDLNSLIQLCRGLYHNPVLFQNEREKFTRGQQEDGEAVEGWHKRCLQLYQKAYPINRYPYHAKVLVDQYVKGLTKHQGIASRYMSKATPNYFELLHFTLQGIAEEEYCKKKKGVLMCPYCKEDHAPAVCNLFRMAGAQSLPVEHPSVQKTIEALFLQHKKIRRLKDELNDLLTTNVLDNLDSQPECDVLKGQAIQEDGEHLDFQSTPC